MTKLSKYFFILLTIAGVVACSGKKESEEAASADEWPEMDEFHMVMAEAFHPYKDSANLEPAKSTAAEMARVAEKWANAPIPEKVNNDEVKAGLAQLNIDAAAFTEIAASGDTTKIAASLTGLHDAFHKLQEAWYGADKEGHEHKH
jgi:hypothetical protein